MTNEKKFRRVINYCIQLAPNISLKLEAHVSDAMKRWIGSWHQISERLSLDENWNFRYSCLTRWHLHCQRHIWHIVAFIIQICLLARNCVQKGEICFLKPISSLTLCRYKANFSPPRLIRNTCEWLTNQFRRPSSNGGMKGQIARQQCFASVNA